MNKVRQLLKVKGEHVWTISKESTVLDSLKLMAEKRIGSLVVIEEGQVIGIFTERDYARKVGPERRIPEETCIEEVMTRELITINLPPGKVKRKVFSYRRGINTGVLFL